MTLKIYLLSFALLFAFLIQGCIQTQDRTQTNISVENLTKDAEVVKNDSVGIQTVEPKNIVYIRNFAFSPQVIEINVGESVTWINQDSVFHTATASGVFDSGMLGNGEQFTFTFTNIGEFDYICRPHPYMKGKVIVR
ncbi:MAG: cupredoxin family copper-binding protein [Candidatus Micrarchaeia archaeon]